MTVSHMDVLSETVALYDGRGAPVTPPELAEKLDTDDGRIRTCFEDLESKCLLKQVTGGYRPTVTARELLELELSGDLPLVVDPAPGDQN